MKTNLTLKIKRVLTNNLGIKLMAALFAIALWLIVVNVDDPTQTRTFSAPVTVINEDALTESGRYYTIPDGNNTVQFRVTAKRSVIEKLKSTDFTATADMRLLEDDRRIPVTVTVNSGNSNITISSKRLYLNVVVGDDMVVKKEVSVVTQGNLAEGCVVSSTEVTPKNITMTGPAEVLSQVANVVAFVDVTDASEDMVAEGAVLHFLDKNGEELDRSRITVDTDVVDVAVKILRVKEVAINVTTSGELPDGLYLDEVSVKPGKISIMGQSDRLNDISVINIPNSVVNLSELNESVTIAVDLNTYLPEGVKVATGVDAQVEITVEISGETSKTFEISADNIAVKNLGDDLEASLDDKKVKVNITASKEALAKLSAEAITGYVDASGLSEGKHTLQLVLDLGDEYKIEPVTVKITIS